MPFGYTSGSTSRAVNALFSQTEDGTWERDAGEFRVVRVHSGMLDDVIDVLVRGECGTTTTAPDPLLDWVYAGRKEGVCAPLPTPPSADRETWFRWLMTYSAPFALSRGGLYALVDPASRKPVAAAVTCPPHCVGFDKAADEMGANIRRAGMQIAPDILLAPRMKTLGTWQGLVQESQGLGNTRSFLYVDIFSTAPEWQGRGCGSALLHVLGDVADADGVDTFLETAGERNVLFYSKKGGYVEVERAPIAGFVHEGGGVAMRRRAQKGASPAGE